MGNRVLVKTGGAILIALGTLVPMEAKALPFEATPEGFLSYLNSGKIFWDDASKQTFYNPRNCKQDNDYWCDMDIDIVTALGKRTCINYAVVYRVNTGRVHKSARDNAECSKWEKVVETPPEPTPPPQPEPAPQPIPQANQPASSQENCDKFPSPIGVPYVIIGFVSAVVIGAISEKISSK